MRESVGVARALRYIFRANIAMGIDMSKAGFIATVAKQGKVTKADAKRAVELVFGAIESGLKGVRSGGKLQIGTFGTFATSRRGARMGRNPRTGESIKLKPSKSLRFRPATQLKKAAGC
jgi:DNA-binding protein HU-beta